MTGDPQGGVQPPFDSDQSNDASRRRAADEREHLADVRDEALNAREAFAAMRDRVQAGRQLHEDNILAGAAERDGEADARDIIAEKRDEAVSREAFLADRADFGPALRARQSAAVDRSLSKSDRASSAQDRADLTDERYPRK